MQYFCACALWKICTTNGYDVVIQQKSVTYNMPHKTHKAKIFNLLRSIKHLVII